MSRERRCIFCDRSIWEISNVDAPILICLEHSGETSKDYFCESFSRDSKCCLFCDHSMSADREDKTPFLICLDRFGSEGEETEVDEDSICENFSNGKYIR